MLIKYQLCDDIIDIINYFLSFELILHHVFIVFNIVNNEYKRF